MNEETQEFPFLTHVSLQGEDKLCLILNCDEKVVSYYDLDKIVFIEEKAKLLELGDIWWHESNRLLPINVFLRQDMMEFKKYIVTVNVKDIDIISGPETSLNNLTRKRIKKRQITLIKKTK